MRHVHLLIKPASGLCNLNCLYCFYHDIVEKREQASYGLMTEDTLAAVLEKALAAASHSCTIAFSRGRAHLGGAGVFPQGGGAAAAAQREPGADVQTPSRQTGCCWTASGRRSSGRNHFLVGALFGRDEGHPRPLPPGRPGPGDVQPGGARPSAAGKPRGCVQYFNGGQQGHRPACGKDIPLLPAQPLGGTCNLFLAWTPWARSREARNNSLTPEAYGDFLCRLFDLWYRDAKVGRAPVHPAV